MSKKQIVIGGISGLVVVSGLLTFLLWPKHKTSNQQLASGQTLGTNSVPLNQTASNSPDSGGLSVDQNINAANLGQLGNTDQQGADGSSGSGTTQKSVFDPSTFAQYDKYKDAQGGLFADVQKGTGTELSNNMKAAVYYKGWLTDGQLFDESKTDNKGQLQPFVFTMGAHQVIPGWEEALAGMKVGGTRLVIVPPAAGYGEAGHDPIPGGAVLIFQVQLAAVQ